MYSDDNLMNAGISPTKLFKPRTKWEIADRFPELPIIETWNNNYLMTKTPKQIESMFHTGMISADQYESYCAIWRDSAFHYSGLYSSYEF